MNSIKALIFLMALMCFGNQLLSQKHLGNYDQLFLIGDKKPVENIDAFLETPEIDRDEVVQDYFYRLIQFFEIPTELEKRNIAKTGIQLFDYLPHKTYLAAIPFDFSPDELRSLHIRNISKLDATHKIAPTIANDEKVVLQYYSNLSPAFVRSFLKNKNIETYESYNNIHAVVICNNSDLTSIANFPITFFISPATSTPNPEYIPGKNIHRSNILTPQIEGHPQYNGEGIDIAIGDDGMIESHIDFKNRTYQDEVLGDREGSHGEMVAGILAGAGNLNPLMEGTASHANIHVFQEFDAVKKSSALYDERGALITSTSYSDGCNRGYTSLAQLADYQIYNNPFLMHVFSAGNKGNEDCGYGAGKGWGNITGGVKMGKNVLTVGNINAEDQRATSSSRGPANDGRIKPDISANGDGQFSTQPHNTYAEANGSSAAAPGVAGVLAQLYQAYQETHNHAFPPSALIKAAVLNTADDLGNPGPDFSYGFGRINARRALNVLENNYFYAGEVEHMNTHSHFISVPEGTQQLKVMLYWTDPEGSTISSPALVNDLDLRVVTPSGINYYPWVLNSSPDSNLLNLPATRGVDHINNVEQVTIDLPESGLYSFLAEGTAIAHGKQSYYIVYELIQNDITLTYPFGGEKLVPGELERIHWDAHGIDGNFEIEVSYNNGNTWSLLGLATGEQRSFLWEVPNIASNQIKLRIKREAEISTCLTPFTICEVPSNLHIAEVCPDAVRLEWDPVANAESYWIYQLGEKYMEYHSSTESPFIEMPIDDPTQENWYAVAAESKNGLLGRRSIAINDGSDLLNCDLGIDISIHSIASPSNAVLQNCFDAPLIVSINITNSGNAIQSNIPVFYQFDNQPKVEEIYASTLPPGITVNYVFEQKIPTGEIGDHHLTVGVTHLNDQADFNNQLDFDLKVIPSTMAGLPFFQNFDNFNNCSLETNCDVSCPLESGWYNDPNKESDDMDWIVNNGSTSTLGTGPDSDQNTNSSIGKYLYLEGSNGCTNQEAYLLSPCFDLTEAEQPVFSFWYHMKGAHIGRLHVDLFDGVNWFYNIIPTLNDAQGNDWKEIEIDLSAFATKIVNVRFRGVTGDDYLTDIAIDNVAIFDAQSAPYPNFKANKLATCTGQKVNFIDNSTNTPNAWQWIFEPNTVSFTDGTSASSANPIITFDEVGMYHVTLTASNNFGNTQITKSQYIHISEGQPIPFGDKFDGFNLDFEKWDLQNNDHSTTWSSTPTIGRDGFSTRAIFMNNHSYNAVGEKDELQSTIIDLTEAQQPYLRFDWAYAQFNDNFSDGLQVVLSSDCGNYFEHVVFDRHGEDLATVPSQISGWFPQKNYEWKTAKIDLSEFVGSSISIKFVNINGFGNNLFLDNFLVYEKQDFPEASLLHYPQDYTFCLGQESLTFLTTSRTENEFLWDFGEHASPSISSEYGPHVVEFNDTGIYHISLRVENELGYDMAESTIEIIDDPIADFAYSIDNNEATFLNYSIFGENFFWDFGDGTTSTLENPNHHFEPGNTYNVKLTVTNKCGENSTEQILLIITDTKDLENNFFINAYPNPTDDFIIFNMPALNYSGIAFDIIDARGVVVASFDLKEENELFSYQLDVKSLAQGMYFARARLGEKVFVKRFIKTL